MRTSVTPELEGTFCHDESGNPVISFFGEIDLATANEFEAMLSGALSKVGDSHCILVDLRGVEFMGVTGLHCLLGVRGQLREQIPEGSLLVVCGGGIQRLIELCELDYELTPCRDLPEAANGCLIPA